MNGTPVIGNNKDDDPGVEDVEMTGAWSVVESDDSLP